jgi:hypothetical protein
MTNFSMLKLTKLNGYGFVLILEEYYSFASLGCVIDRSDGQIIGPGERGNNRSEDKHLG